MFITNHFWDSYIGQTGDAGVQRSLLDPMLRVLLKFKFF